MTTRSALVRRPGAVILRTSAAAGRRACPEIRRLKRFLLICLAGAAGTGARYLLGGWALRALGADFPYGTLAVNLLGSLLIGAVMEMSVAQGVIGEDWRLVLTTGLLGGFTTYSAFSHETLAYFTRGAYATGGLYLGATLLGCFAAGLLGISVSRAFG